MKKSIDEKIPFFVTTYAWLGEDVIKHSNTAYLSRCFFILLQALPRGIDINLPLETIAEKVAEEVPDIEWFKEILIKESLLDEDEKRLLYNYTSYGYASMNLRLRYAPHAKAPINDIIEKMPPIEKNIYVYRYIFKDEFIPVDKVFPSYGYLSTSIDMNFISRVVCEEETENIIIMRIKVPAGKKAIYVPSREVELIFPHNIQMRLIKSFRSYVLCWEETEINYLKEILVHELEML